MILFSFSLTHFQVTYANIKKKIKKKGKIIKYKMPLTYRSQSTAMIRVTSSAGRPTALSTITMVTSPAWGTPAAPMLAAVAVTLNPK